MLDAGIYQKYLRNKQRGWIIKQVENEKLVKYFIGWLLKMIISSNIFDKRGNPIKREKTVLIRYTNLKIEISCYYINQRVDFTKNLSPHHSHFFPIQNLICTSKIRFSLWKLANKINLPIKNEENPWEKKHYLSNLNQLHILDAHLH